MSKPERSFSVYHYGAPDQETCDAELIDSFTGMNLREAIEFAHGQGEHGFDSVYAVEASSWPEQRGSWFTVFYSSGETVQVIPLENLPSPSSARLVCKAISGYWGQS